jgi:uncharacterized surface anchored protein
MTSKFLLTLSGACFLAQLAHGQSTFGDLRGVTRDPSGLPLTQATVDARNLEENTERKVVSGDDGSFVIQNLKPGHYQLTATRAGFESDSPVEIQLSARQSLRVDVALVLQTQSATVEVSSAADQVNTENGIIGDTKVSNQIAQLPLNFRAVSSSPLAALATSPNVQ